MTPMIKMRDDKANETIGTRLPHSNGTHSKPDLRQPRSLDYQTNHPLHPKSSSQQNSATYSTVVYYVSDLVDNLF